MTTTPRIFVDVLLPVAVPNLYTYHIDESLIDSPPQTGMRVCIQFGKRKLYTALVIKVHETPPADYKTKSVLAVLDTYPVVQAYQFQFWSWMAEYYMCTRGEVFNAALPAGLKPEGQSKLYLQSLPDEGIQMTPTEEHLYHLLNGNPGISIEKLTALSGKKNIMPTLNKLADMGVVKYEEGFSEKFKPKMVSYVNLHKSMQIQVALNELITYLEKRAPKQCNILMAYLDLSGYVETKTFSEVNKSELIAKSKASPAAMKSLIDKEIFIEHQKESTRLFQNEIALKEIAAFNEPQKKAHKEIKEAFKDKDVALLHGVTSSGKTEIYIHLIKEQIDKGKQVLYLLPEIALTAQIINRLQSVFGSSVGIYHSKFSDAERVEVWNNLLGIYPEGAQPYKVILGVRSSLFLPFKNLGLIIVDEEHENTYKQYDPAPRYHARDSAIYLAAMLSANSNEGAKVLLGTATPSFETYYNAKLGRYALVELFERYKNIQLPKIEVVNIREARRKKQMNGHFSPQLISHIRQALNNNEQIILFQNRRGFSSFLECTECAWIPECSFCDVSLTYHKGINRLVCHYCGHNQSPPMKCAACGSTDIHTRGFGTEKIEDDIKLLFKDASVLRMDLDSTRKKKAYEEIIEQFATGQVDILIGTQMVSKGLDFDNVSIVGILDADQMLNYPDFRAHERSFQLMAQVSGRAGRKHKQGMVVIQTTNPQSEVIKHVVNNTYFEFARKQIAERKQFFYPPLYRIIKLTLRHKQKEIVGRAAIQLTNVLKKQFGGRVLGPETPMIGRIQNWHLKTIIIKIDKTVQLAPQKKYITDLCDRVKVQPGYSTLQVITDVDPS